MMMGLSDLLALAHTPEEKEEIRASIKRVMDMRDEDIDYSDIPEVTDFSGWKPARPFLDKIRKKNRRIRFQREGLPDPDELTVSGMRCLEEHLGNAGAEAFIGIILDDRLDYAKWRQKAAGPMAAV